MCMPKSAGWWNTSPQTMLSNNNPDLRVNLQRKKVDENLQLKNILDLQVFFKSDIKCWCAASQHFI